MQGVIGLLGLLGSKLKGSEGKREDVFLLPERSGWRDRHWKIYVRLLEVTTLEGEMCYKVFIARWSGDPFMESFRMWGPFSESFSDAVSRKRALCKLTDLAMSNLAEGGNHFWRDDSMIEEYARIWGDRIWGSSSF